MQTDPLDAITRRAGAAKMTTQDIIKDILIELEYAESIHPQWPTDPLHAVAVLGEEFGELTQAVLDVVYSPARGNLNHVREEAIQTAAMAIRFLINMEKYRYERAAQ